MIKFVVESKCRLWFFNTKIQRWFPYSNFHEYEHAVEYAKRLPELLEGPYIETFLAHAHPDMYAIQKSASMLSDDAPIFLHMQSILPLDMGQSDPTYKEETLQFLGGKVYKTKTGVPIWPTPAQTQGTP